MDRRTDTGPTPSPNESPLVQTKSLLLTAAVALAVVVAHDKIKANGGLKVSH